jgi:RNase P subunit RPR2
MNTIKAKILLLDIETAPAICYTWGIWQQDIGISQIVDDGYVLCWCAKWLGQDKVMSDSLINYPKHFKNNPRCDKKIAESIWKLVDEADIVVTHNGNDFDLKWLNTLFMKHQLKPVSSYKSVDTKLEIKKKFRFISNKLDFLCKKLELGRKISTGGFELWTECMGGNKESFSKMLTYCKHDVNLLEKLYLTIRPYITKHPNLNLYNTVISPVCPNCGSIRLIRKGFEYTAASKYQRFECLECGKKSRGTKAEPRTSQIVTGV